jgi:hypothetical protein
VNPRVQALLAINRAGTRTSWRARRQRLRALDTLHRAGLIGADFGPHAEFIDAGARPRADIRAALGVFAKDMP